MDGTWTVIGSSDELRSLFPPDPEIYHMNGIAESPGGAIRQISEEEEVRAGLRDNSYHQAYMSEFLQRMLESGRIVEA